MTANDNNQILHQAIKPARKSAGIFQRTGKVQSYPRKIKFNTLYVYPALQ